MADERAGKPSRKCRDGLVCRQSIWTRVTHWGWAICLFFLRLTGLHIFNAHPTLYVGQESGFEYNNAILSMTAENTADGPRGYTTVFWPQIRYDQIVWPERFAAFGAGVSGLGAIPS